MEAIDVKVETGADGNTYKVITAAIDTKELYEEAKKKLGL